MKYKCFIFDLDGTLLDSLQGILDAVNISFEEHNINVVRTYEEGKYFIGAGARVFASRAMEGLKLTFEQKTDILTSFFKNYAKTQLISAKPFAGLEEMLSKIKENNGYITIATNKPQMLMESVLDHAYPNTKFDIALGQREGKPEKPDPFIIFEIFNKLNVKPDECIYVGDSEYDLLTAHNAGIDCVICKYGYGFYDKPWIKKATYIVDSVKDLEKLLTN